MNLFFIRFLKSQLLLFNLRLSQDLLTRSFFDMLGSLLDVDCYDRQSECFHLREKN
jgi:hypothetical protein